MSCRNIGDLVRTVVLYTAPKLLKVLSGRWRKYVGADARVELNFAVLRNSRWARNTVGWDSYGRLGMVSECYSQDKCAVQ